MDTRLDDAFAAVPREDFLPPDQRAFAHQDRPIPIGHRATNSQPWTVRYMLRHLDARPGHRVLDVGSGSGWTAGLLGWLVGPEGLVVGVEIVPELVEMARGHLGDRFGHVRFEVARQRVLGWPDEAPYDRILVSADGRIVPDALLDQLAPGGRMVLPVDGDMYVLDKDAEGVVSRRKTGDRFVFVPLR
ncbi:MAG TPA: protein-L-isoaspartate O-methyltransferase [Propionibacterium sp.]|nr:protein-L-isoaspartate O-methyltransferase [Propionibacterium sp.]